ncbi:hypothetical protein COR50_17365 [Chitinophaga caeni]|uniref:TIR domain-containing protein n=1 Tax=Chitinophaga caeni TaxID=2029983 RepID=A0A291QXN2_9BACT|nr:toll/interleukin-1 receptor domain-containing protein [Chitinophaga caeni]ATL48789.1 hypothetical protein COR50_17365 [Chitinophaga caeni]
MKTKIFLSHTTPEDNYFAIWLASKLKLLGYDVWIELEELSIGDAFWPQIESTIREDSAKFIPIISKSYCAKVKNQRTGVFKEISCADRVKNISNFISPVCIDATNPDDFPVQILGLHSIDFYDNWQEGLDTLVKNLKRQQIPIGEPESDSIGFWLDSFKIGSVVNDKPEKIYTNWFDFNLPEKLYVHQPVLSRKMDLLDFMFPFIVEGNRHISFFPADDYPQSISCTSTYSFLVDDILKEKAVSVDDFFILNDPKRKIVKLLNHTIEAFLYQKGLKKYEQSKSPVFFYPSTESHRKRISLKDFDKNNVSVTGKHIDKFWSFGISSYALIYPFPYFKIDSHIIFTNNRHEILEMDEQHKLRRKLGSGWYNKDWLEKLLGMMYKISDTNSEHLINIPIAGSAFLTVNSIPKYIMSDFGYLEPQKQETDNEATVD